jgi:hypothetical protein
LDIPTGHGFFATFGAVETASLSRAVKGLRRSREIETVYIYIPTPSRNVIKGGIDVRLRNFLFRLKKYEQENRKGKNMTLFLT